MRSQLPQSALRALVPIVPVLAALAALGAFAGAQTGELPAELLDPQQVEPISRQQFEQLLAHLQGEVVLVNLWATWCVPCVQELPELDQLQQEYRDRGLRVIAVSLDDPEKLEEQVRPFFAEKAPGMVSYLSTEEDSFTFVEPLDPEWIGALPTSFFIDRSGEVRESVTGRLLYRTFVEKVEPLLGES
jgi:thiol-disulfide isomerase/thioredoxin